jgi:RND family efflux transporter MFP subunit
MAPPPFAFRLLVPAFLIVCTTLGCGGAKPKEEEKPPPHVVEWESPAEVILREWIELLGTVQPLPENAVRVSAPVDGRVLEVLPGIAEGQEVEKDTVLVKLDDTIARTNADKAKALRDAAEQDDVQAKSALGLAEKRLASLKDVSNIPIPELQKEEARVAVEDAKSKMVAAAKRLTAAEKDAKAAEEQLNLYSLKATIRGRLDRILVTKGQNIPPGTVVAEVANTEKAVDVLCFVPLNVAQRLGKGGQQVEVGGVEPGKASGPYTGPKGRVAFVAERADTDTGNFAVKVRFDQPSADNDKLRPNTVVRIRVLLRRGPGLSIRETALLEDTDPPTVVIVEEVETRKDKEGKEETVGKARRLQATRIGMRDRVQGQVEILELMDPETKKKWGPDELRDVVIAFSKNQGLQTGDVLKKDEEPPEEEGK